MPTISSEMNAWLWRKKNSYWPPVCQHKNRHAHNSEPFRPTCLWLRVPGASCCPQRLWTPADAILLVPAVKAQTGLKSSTPEPRLWKHSGQTKNNMKAWQLPCLCLVGACTQGGQMHVAVYVNTREQVQCEAQGSQPPCHVHPWALPHLVKLLQRHLATQADIVFYQLKMPHLKTLAYIKPPFCPELGIFFMQKL